MAKLAIGNNLISIETATKQVRRNIQELMQKKALLTHGVSGNARAVAFYEKRIAAQKVLLIWLRKAV
jgi:hypothetical protein